MGLGFGTWDLYYYWVDCATFTDGLLSVLVLIGALQATGKRGVIRDLHLYRVCESSWLLALICWRVCVAMSAEHSRVREYVMEAALLM